MSANSQDESSSEIDSDEDEDMSPPVKKFCPNLQVKDEDEEDVDARPSFGMSTGHLGINKPTSNNMMLSAAGTSSVPVLASSFIKKETSAADKQAMYNDVAMKLMAKMGFKEGQGLGKTGQGIKAPVEASKQKGRRGLGMQPRGFEAANIEWDFDKEHVSADETVDWLPENKLPVPPLKELQSWLVEGSKKLTIDDETNFCSSEILNGVLSSKSVFDNLEEEEMRKARTRSNPYETIRGAFFLNRAAMKMANMDAVLDFMFTNPRDKNGRPVVGPNELLYFADICAGPGGFSEYVLWRKKWDAKGFGFTLRGPNDFKLEDFFAAPCELFEPHYGVNGTEGDGDIYNPDNLREFHNFVMESTDNQGVHFVMADGGFSVEGQENIQEILSKRLYLCQFLCALMVLRTGGCFVCKLFDLFTLFSVGLVYLMYRAFDRVAVFKPVTSRPANSERYIVCQGKRADSTAIQQYMFEINERMCSIWPGSSLSKIDVSEVVPFELIHDDEVFYQYIYDSNIRLGEQQIISLVKIQAFAQNTELREPRQADIRRQCLEKWQIPDEVRTAPDKNVQPSAKFLGLTKDLMSDYQTEPTVLTSSCLSDKIKSIFDYRCVITGSDQRGLIIGLGRSHVFRWDNKSSKWHKVDEVKLELPKDTIVEVEFVQELRGEGKGQRRVMAVHVIDALFLFGTDVRQLHFNERIEKVKKFVRAISRPTRSDLAPIRVKEPVRFEQIETVFQSLELKVIKGSGQQRRICYCCHNQGDHNSRFIVPTGLLLIRIVSDPWMMAMSRSQRRKYYYHIHNHNAVFETPKDSVASYLQCLKSRLFWPWSESILLGQDSSSVTNSKPDISNSRDALSRQTLLQFVQEKLH